MPIAIFSVSSSTLWLWPQMAGAAAGESSCAGEGAFTRRVCAEWAEVSTPREELWSLRGHKSHPPCTTSHPTEQSLPPLLRRQRVTGATGKHAGPGQRGQVQTCSDPRCITLQSLRDPLHTEEQVIALMASVPLRIGKQEEPPSHSHLAASCCYHLDQVRASVFLICKMDTIIA